MTSDTKPLVFTKMHGLGNDFVVIDYRDLPNADPAQVNLEKLTIALCDRHFGIGADGLIVVTPPLDKTASDYDLEFIYLNRDGGRAEMCGNGTRCFALFAKDKGLTTKNTMAVKTLAGLIQPTVNDDGTVTVDMGEPSFAPESIPFAGEANDEYQGSPLVKNLKLEVLGKMVPVTLVSMGNPHCLIFVGDLDFGIDSAVYGPEIESHDDFPNRTNVEFLTVMDQNTIQATVWERGCGFTLACGTGACATAVGSVLLGKTGNTVNVDLPGGTLNIHWDQEKTHHVFMTGPASYAFEGTVDLDWETFMINSASSKAVGSVNG